MSLARYTSIYLAWRKESTLPPLTRTQYEFAEFLLDNHEKLKPIGDLDGVYKSVREWLKTNPEIPNSKS